MKITMFSINPLFEGVIMGGAPKHLQSVAIYMGEQGHDITILCTRTKDNTQPFKWHDNVQVFPILPFKQPFPQPYAIQAYEFAEILQAVGDKLNTADRFYMHDGEFLFPYAYQNIPTVVSLRDNVYPETIHGGYLFQADRMILISEYSKNFYLATVGRFFEDFHKRIDVIHNGLDWQKFRYTEPDEILEYIPFDPSEHTVILHPHRPEPSKGIMQTIAVVDLLVNRYGIKNIKTLIPRWLDVQLSTELREFYDDVESEINERGLRDHIVLHGWIPQELMPQYYSLGAVTFSLGHFAESFGNAVYESLGCGTPSIAARISTHRELLPEPLIDKVDFNDIEAAAEIARDIILDGRRTSAETLAYLRTHYSVDRQREAYAQSILNAKVAPPMHYQHPTLTPETSYALAPWCYQNDKGKIYHDFRADYVDMGILGALLEAHPQGVTLKQALANNITELDFMNWYREGYIYPLTGSAGTLTST